MHRKTITREDIVDAVRQSTQLSKGEATAKVEQVLNEIIDCLGSGENVLLSSFGTFVVRDRKSRMGRNPNTGEPALISRRRAVIFKPSPKLIKQMNSHLAE